MSSAVKIEITDSAIKQLKETHGLGGDKFLRLAVVSGGCSGMKYGAAIDDLKVEGDLVILQVDGFDVVAAMKDVSYLDGVVLDYSEDLMDAGFNFTNKNNKGGCSCGASFSC